MREIQLKDAKATLSADRATIFAGRSEIERKSQPQYHDALCRLEPSFATLAGFSAVLTFADLDDFRRLKCLTRRNSCGNVEATNIADIGVL